VVVVVVRAAAVRARVARMVAMVVVV